MCIESDSDTALETKGTHALIDTEITKEGQVPSNLNKNMKFFLHDKFHNIKSLMPSGNCNLQKCPHRPKMANSAYNGCECQVGKGSEEGRGDHMCPYMEYL